MLKKLFKKKKKSNDDVFDASIDIKKNEANTIINEVKSYTMTSLERMFALYNSVEYVIKNNIPGDFVECGVWKGGSSMIIAKTLLKLGVTDRKIYLYDTFEGMAKPEEVDVDVLNSSALNKWDEADKNDYAFWCESPLENVKNNMSLTTYPMDNIIFVKGKVEDTIPGTIPENIALLRLDTDFYSSTYHEFFHLYPILSKNGVLIIDDYGHWKGSKEATDKYFKENNIFPLMNRIDYTGRLIIKS